jgi:hypothetical protein
MALPSCPDGSEEFFLAGEADRPLRAEFGARRAAHHAIVGIDHYRMVVFLIPAIDIVVAELHTLPAANAFIEVDLRVPRDLLPGDRSFGGHAGDLPLGITE